MGDPVLFTHDFAGEFVTFGFFVFQQGIAPIFKPLEPLVELPGFTAVHPNRFPRQVFQKPAVMADHDDGAGYGRQFCLKPFDCGQIKMVGWFVD